MSELEQVRQLALTYYMIYLNSGLQVYKDKAYEIGTKYRILKYKTIRETTILKLVA